jgi:hypothetical protein
MIKRLSQAWISQLTRVRRAYNSPPWKPQQIQYRLLSDTPTSSALPSGMMRTKPKKFSVIGSMADLSGMLEQQTALIVRQNEQVVEGTVSLDQPRHDRPDVWTGSIRLPEGRRIEPSHCQLHLSNGHRGEIVIYRLDAGPDCSTIAHFRGVGALRRAS